ncbi:MAG: uroporphyrinogen decarboxylase family protein [Candidatus Bipolaricaulia bacterium]
MMDSWERVQMAFAHREPDRVPIWELTIDPPISTQILGREPIYRNKRLEQELLIQGDRDSLVFAALDDAIELYRSLELDILPVELCPPTQVREVLPEGNYYPPERLEEGVYRIPLAGDQWRIIRYDPKANFLSEVDSSIKRRGLPAFQKHVVALEAQNPVVETSQLDGIRYAQERVGNEMVILERDIDIAFPSGATWMDRFLMWMITEPGWVHRWIEVQLRQELVKIETVGRLGVKFALGGVDFAYNRGPFFSPTHFQTFYGPVLKELTEVCHRHGIAFIKHSDGNINPILETIVEAGVDGLHAIEPRAGMDIGALKERYRDRLTLCGNVDCGLTLCEGSEDEVRQSVREIIRAAAPGGGFTLTSSNTIHAGVKPENYLAMLDEARSFGRYPIAV